MKKTIVKAMPVIKVLIKLAQSIILLAMAYWFSQIIWNNEPKSDTEKKLYTALIWFAAIACIEAVLFKTKTTPIIDEKHFYCANAQKQKCQSQCPDCDMLQSESTRV